MMTASLRMGLGVGVLMNLLVLLGVATGQVATPSWADTPVLGWRDFFKLPIGPRGLEPTDTLVRLKNQRVQVQGYMVKEEEPVPGLFMLTPMLVAMAELADGPADYLPAATLFVHLDSINAEKIFAYRPGIWALSGILRVGAQHEANGRVSYVRLFLDDLTSVRTPDRRPPDLLSKGLLRHGHRH